MNRVMVMPIGLVLSLLRRYHTQQTQDKATVSKNWTTDMQDVVPESKKNNMSSALQAVTQRNETHWECCHVGMRKLIGGWALRELIFIGRDWG